MRSLFFFIICLLGASISSLNAQTIDPYRRLTDPRAITYLDGVDAEPLQYRCAVGWPDRDSTDAYFLLAKGEGSGIVTHLWMQLQGRPDSVTDLKIYIDDSLVIHDHLYSFFSSHKGSIRPPLDSFQSGGLVCDVQMPFKRNFRITYNASYDYCCLFWAIGWRPVLDPVHVEVFNTKPTPQAEAQQKAAEDVYWSGDSPWKDTPVETMNVGQTIGINSPIEREIIGPGLITELHIKPSIYNTDALRNLWVEFYWDGSPRPSVSVPLADFFGAGSGMRDMRSHPIRTQKNGWLTCYFPMPFAVSARLKIVNRSEEPVDLNLICLYTREPVDRTRMGYFEAQFNEKKDSRYHVYHPVGYHQGRGRFVGMQLFIPSNDPPYFLEGDPLFHIDSNDANFIRYTGTEDYFNGGWFFTDGAFSLPFAGCTETHTSFYRFHYMDAIDFKNTFELLLQHGSKNDFKTWYRSVGYFYDLWTPFWVSRDTIRYGEVLQLNGSGYGKGEAIRVTLDEDELATLNADASGNFEYQHTFTKTTQVGGHILAVNGTQRPEPLWIISKPDIYFKRDTFPGYVNWKDTVTIHGTGFTPNKQVSLFLDSIEMLYSSPVMTDSQGQFATKALIPYAPDGDYHIIAGTGPTERSISKQTLQNTRSYTLEIENMWPPVLQEAYAHQDYMGYYGQSWSEQYYLYFAGGVGKRVAVKFEVSVSDTFDISCFATLGVRFGNYQMRLDNFPPIIFNGYEDRNINDPIRSGPLSFGIHYLSEGPHFLTFECVGKDDRSLDYLLGVDNLLLRPITDFQHIPTARTPTSISTLPTFTVYPNPVDNLLKIFMGVDTIDRLIDAEIIDALGIVRSSYRSQLVPSDGALSVFLKDLSPGQYYIRLTEEGVGIGGAMFIKL